MDAGFSLEDFDYFIRDANYGDDLLLASRHDDFVRQLPALLLARGIKLSSAKEKGAPLELSTLEQVTFLKRAFFKREDGLLVPQFPKEEMWELLKWQRKGDVVERTSELLLQF